MKYKFNYFLITTILFINKDAQAYLEPGTVNLILQSIIGALAAAGTIVYLYWIKIKNIIIKYIMKKKKPK
tara:strand:+ start:1285 stop:1494 length:210 start_codon:yes stop_codon:yes gene_type:complete